MNVHIVINVELQTFIEVLKAIQEIKDSCFGPMLKPTYQKGIDRFEKAWYEIYIEFEIPFSNKCHVLIEHVPQVIQTTRKSLYLSSVQVVEGSHAKFITFWQRYKVLDLERENHGSQLSICVIDFNFKNL